MIAHHASDNLSQATVKHFTAEELYDIAAAERDDYHTEDEVREEIRSFLEEEKAMMD